MEAQDFGWANSHGTGNADDAVTSGLEVIWSKTPTKWSNGILFNSALPTSITDLEDYLNSLFRNTWTLVKSPAGAFQYEALNGTIDYPNPFNKTFRRATMLVSDLALREDPIYRAIAESWSTDFNALTTAFAAAWCKYPTSNLSFVFLF
jgi:catalase-peroxidase